MTPTTAVGLFDHRSQAVAAVQDLRAAGFAENEIGVIARRPDEEGTDPTDLGHDPTGTRWEEGAGIGAAAGALTGTGLGLAVAAGLIPPLGPVIAGGALIALLASAGAGAAVGTVMGGLVGLGIPEEEAAVYEGHISEGKTLVAVASGTRYLDAVEILRRHGAHIRTAMDQPATP